MLSDVTLTYKCRIFAYNLGANSVMREEAHAEAVTVVPHLYLEYSGLEVGRAEQLRNGIMMPVRRNDIMRPFD